MGSFSCPPVAQQACQHAANQHLISLGKGVVPTVASLIESGIFGVLGQTPLAQTAFMIGSCSGSSAKRPGEAHANAIRSVLPMHPTQRGESVVVRGICRRSENRPSGYQPSGEDLLK